MERKLRKFVPYFLQRIDRDWMLNRPYLRATKIHYVLFYGLVALALSVGFGQLQPISASQISISTSFLITLSIPALLALAYWWYLLSNVFSRYAHDIQIWRRNFMLIIGGSLLIVAVPISGWFVMEWRTMEVREEINRLEDTKTLAKGVFLFESVLPTQLYSTYRKGQRRERSWLYNYDQEDALKDFVKMEPAILAQDFLEMAHRYLPESYPISAEDLAIAYRQKKFPPQFQQEALWEWRQALMKSLNYWEELGILNPFILHSEHSLPSVRGMDWKAIYSGILLILIPFMLLGLSLVYLGFRPFVGFVLSICALVGLVSLLAQFMTYRVNITEFFYGMTAIVSFFSLYFGFNQLAKKTWQLTAQKVALFIGISGLYALMILGPSVLFNLTSAGPPSPLLVLGILTLLSALWLGPFQKRINDLQTEPSTF